MAWAKPKLIIEYSIGEEEYFDEYEGDEYEDEYNLEEMEMEGEEELEGEDEAEEGEVDEEEEAEEEEDDTDDDTNIDAEKVHIKTFFEIICKRRICSTAMHMLTPRHITG